jgi:hypothetical protein
MKIPIFLSPSQQTENSCKFGDNEQAHCRLIAGELYNIFAKDPRFICQVVGIITGTVEQKCNGAVYQSDSFISSNSGSISGNPSYHIAIHTNAGGGSGIAGFYKGSGKGFKATQNCVNRLVEISPWGQQEFREWPGLIEMKTIASTVYLECNFHDNLAQATWIHNNIRNLAIAIYKGICDTENLEAINTTMVETNDLTWKKEAVQKCIDQGLLTDVNWLNKVDDSIPVFAVALMLDRLNTKINNNVDTKIINKINELFAEQNIKIITKK